MFTLVVARFTLHNRDKYVSTDTPETPRDEDEALGLALKRRVE